MLYVICRDKIPDKFWARHEKAILNDEIRKVFFPENRLQPDAQVQKAKSVVKDYISKASDLILMTASPFMLKAIDIFMDLFECQDELKYIDSEGEETDFQKMMKPFSDVFAKLMHGEHFEETLL